VLRDLLCFGNELNSLNVSQNSSLEDLSCEYNNIASLDVSQNSALLWLFCSSNVITSLDISQNSALLIVSCSDNHLNCLNMKSGNPVWADTSLYAIGNPNLICIEVDDVAWADTNWVSNDPNGWNNIDPGVSFSTDCNNACSSLPCSVSANFTYSDNGNGNYTFSNTSSGNFSFWNFGDGNISTDENPNHTFAANGTFVVALAVSDSSFLTGGYCADYATETIEVTGVQNPAQCNAGFVVFPDPLSPNVLVVNSSTGNGLSYFWDFGDGNTSTEASPFYTYSGTGPFELCITVNDGAGCSDTYCDSIGSNGIVLKVGSGFSINVISPLQVGIEQQESQIGSIGIFPNPASTQLHILNPESVAISQIRIVDMTGRIVKAVQKNTNAVDVSFLPSGVYFIEFVSETGTVIEKFVKR